MPLCVIFSRDRAMQLDALLESMSQHVVDPPEMRILFRATTGEHLEAYQQVVLDRSLNQDELIKESPGQFRRQLLHVLRSSHARHCLFLVDDMVFTENVDLAELAGLARIRLTPSLRLGLNISYAFTVQRAQKLPSFTSSRASVQRDGSVSLREWQWDHGECDWAYPLSLDGNIFPRRWILGLLALVPFAAPNSLEARLQRLRFLYRGARGVCLEKSPVVNIPANRVQQEFANLHGDLHQDELLRLWNLGYRVDVRSLSGWVNDSPHADICLPLHMPERGGRA